MLRPARLIIGIIGALSIAAMAAVAGSGRLSGHDNAVAGELNRPAATASGVGSLQPAGSPSSLSNAPGVPGIAVGTPAMPGSSTFSEEAVRQYFAANPSTYWDPSTPQPEIMSIAFLTSKQAEADIGHEIPRAPGDLLCIVKLRGSFVPQLPPGVTPVSTSSDSESTVVVIFDAVTGNLLGQGYLAQP